MRMCLHWPKSRQLCESSRPSTAGVHQREASYDMRCKQAGHPEQCSDACLQLSRTSLIQQLTRSRLGTVDRSKSSYRRHVGTRGYATNTNRARHHKQGSDTCLYPADMDRRWYFLSRQQTYSCLRMTLVAIVLSSRTQILS